MNESLELIERSFVGGVILSPAETDRLDRPVSIEDFSEWRCGVVYQAALQLYHRQPTLAGDATAVIAQLDLDGELARVGGAPEVFKFVQEACVAGSVSWHARRIVDAARLRHVGMAAMRIQQAVAARPVPTEAEEAEQLQRYAWEQLEQALAPASERTVRPILDVFDEWLARTESPAIPIGFPDLARDVDIAGAHPGRLLLFAARPSVGKSTALTQAAVTAAAAGHGVLFVTLEMTAGEVLERCLANYTASPLTTLRDGALRALPDALRPIRVVDSSMSVSDIAAAVRVSRRSQHPVDVVIVDYVQLVTPPSGTGENRQTEVAAIARALKRLAVDERVAVVAASQLNRASESRAERRPTLADLRESGELENAADAVVLLHRDSDLPENLLMIVAKNRHGRVGETSVMAMYDRASFVSFGPPPLAGGARSAKGSRHLP